MMWWKESRKVNWHLDDTSSCRWWTEAWLKLGDSMMVVEFEGWTKCKWRKMKIGEVISSCRILWFLEIGWVLILCDEFSVFLIVFLLQVQGGNWTLKRWRWWIEWMKNGDSLSEESVVICLSGFFVYELQGEWELEDWLCSFWRLLRIEKEKYFCSVFRLECLERKFQSLLPLLMRWVCYKSSFSIIKFDPSLNLLSIFCYHFCLHFWYFSVMPLL